MLVHTIRAVTEIAAVAVRILYAGGSHTNNLQFQVELPEWSEEEGEAEEEEEEDEEEEDDDDDLSGGGSVGSGGGDGGAGASIAV
jgi:hypothetical protein